MSKFANDVVFDVTANATNRVVKYTDICDVWVREWFDGISPLSDKLVDDYLNDYDVDYDIYDEIIEALKEFDMEDCLNDDDIMSIIVEEVKYELKPYIVKAYEEEFNA